jgi:hypothetical protein
MAFIRTTGDMFHMHLTHIVFTQRMRITVTLCVIMDITLIIGGVFPNIRIELRVLVRGDLNRSCDLSVREMVFLIGAGNFRDCILIMLKATLKI